MNYCSSAGSYPGQWCLMRFLVTVEDKAWAKLAKRLETSGYTGSPAELLEGLLVTSITDDAPKRHVGEITLTSTSLMMIMGRVRVELLDR